MRRAGWLSLVGGVALLGCASVQGLVEVETVIKGQPMVCAGGGYAETVLLHGSPNDPAITWIEFVGSDRRENVVWPHGYFARFSPQLVVFDPSGAIVASEGDQVSGGCPMPNGELISL